MVPIRQFLKTLQESDHYMQYIFTQGSCYQLYKILKLIYPTAEAYFNLSKQHVLIKYEGKFYDILGEYYINVQDLIPFTESDHEMANNWSFYRNNQLTSEECPHCLEPLPLKL